MKCAYKEIKRECSDGAIEYSFLTDEGDSRLRVYELLPGTTLTHHSVHAYSSYRTGEKGPGVIEIHHCREGRMECSFENGSLYLMPGDLALTMSDRPLKEYYFPLRHYHGITITIDTHKAPECFSCFLKDVNVQPLKVARRLCADNQFFVIRSREYIEHLFSEMYHVPCESTKGYYKIKVMELLLILSGIDPGENRINTRTLSGSQVMLAKSAASFIASNQDIEMTVPLLAKRFNVSATHLQNAFKGVFGVPVFSYIRILRMNAAALALVTTDKSVMEIAGESGYDNASKFASAFREIMNETPLEYRKSHRLL